MIAHPLIPTRSSKSHWNRNRPRMLSHKIQCLWYLFNALYVYSYSYSLPLSCPVLQKDFSHLFVIISGFFFVVYPPPYYIGDAEFESASSNPILAWNLFNNTFLFMLPLIECGQHMMSPENCTIRVVLCWNIRAHVRCFRRVVSVQDYFFCKLNTREMEDRLMMKLFHHHNEIVIL